MQKTIKRTDKRGFTTVELVIVISVIAVLAAVLIPTFAHLIKKANQSAALQDIRNAYELTLTEDMAKPSEERQVQGMEVYVEHPNGTRVYITIDGEASIDETDNALTHELRGERLARLDTDTDEDGTPDIEDDDDDNDGIPDDEDDDDNNDGTPDVDDPYHPSNGGNNHQGSNPGGSETPDQHTHTYTYTDNEDSRTHIKTCAGCGESVTETHHYYDGNCICTAQHIFTYQCNKNCKFTAQVRNNNGVFEYYNESLSEWLKLAACSGGDGHEDHYDCPKINGNIACNGCFKDTCEHKNIGAYTQKDNNYHYAYCTDCLEEVLIKHNPILGTCNYCGYHNHNFGSAYVSDAVPAGYHRQECISNGCDYYRDIAHRCASPNKYTTDANEHAGVCDDCGTEFAENHEWSNSGSCGKCLYTPCTHNESTLVWNKTPDTHEQVCKTCKHNGGDLVIIKAEPHVDANNDGKCDVCGLGSCEHTSISNGAQCPSCNAFIYVNNTSYFGSAGGTWTDANSVSHPKDYVFVFTKNMTGTATAFGNSTTSKNATITIDLGGNTLTLTSYVTVNCKTLIIKNGTLKVSNYMGISKGNQTLTLDNVTVVKTGYGNGMITSASNTTINITNGSNINVSGDTNKRVIYFHANNITGVNITISDSNISCNKLVHFNSATQGSMGNNTITISGNTAINGTTIAQATDVDQFLHQANGINIIKK